jgi:hypothetical protein
VIVRTILTRRLPFAALLAVVLVLGALGGSLAYETTNPEFTRIVWLEHDGARPDGDTAVRRALFSDGRFLVLAGDGTYRAGILDPGTTAEVFATVRGAARGWRTDYHAKGVVGEMIELQLLGAAPRQIQIANPDMNLALPPGLARVLRTLEATDRGVATVVFRAGAVRFQARAVDAADGPVEPMPVGLTFEDIRQEDGLVLQGSDLALVESTWTDVDERFDPSLAHRFVSVDGHLWRISWSLDLESVGGLPTPGASQ